MSYFESVKTELNFLVLWAELRHEQGVEVEPNLAKLHKQIEALRRQLEESAPSPCLRRAEPN